MTEPTVTFVHDGDRWLTPLGGLVAEVRGDQLRIYQQDGTGVAHFPLTPRVDGGLTTLKEWRIERGVLTANLVEYEEVEVHIWARGGRVHYRLQCPFPGIVDFTYFPGATFRGPGWQTFVSDTGDRNWSKADPHSVTVATAVDLGADALAGRPSTWMITPPPRACALQYDQGWLALVIPHPLPVAATTFTVERTEEFHINFAHYRPANAPGTHGPEIVFMGGLSDPYQALDELAILSREMGLTHGPAQAASWWPRPIFCTWGEQVALSETYGNAERTLSPERVRAWVALLRERLGTADFTVLLDAGWYEHLGEYNVNPAFGDEAGLRALIDALHAGGHRVLLWFTPYALDREAPVVAAQADGLLKTPGDDLASRQGAPLLRDLTVPAMREQLRAVIHRLLHPTGLNADGLKLDFLYHCPDPRTMVAQHSAWGEGDQLWATALRFMAEAARAAKPEALLSISSAMPYLQPHCGAVRLNDNFEATSLPWQRRARIVTRTLPGTLLDVDGWPLRHENAVAHWMTSPVYGMPALYHVTRLDDRLPLTVEDYHRIGASWAVYANAPVWTDQRISIEPEQGLYERYYPDGTLAAQSLEQTVLVTVSPREIRACAGAARRIALPVTSAQTVTDVHLVGLDGTTTSYAIGDVAQRPLFATVPDAGEQGQYLRLLLE